MSKIISLWCRGTEEVIDINKYMRFNYTRNRNEILLIDKNDKVEWCEFEYNKKKTEIYIPVKKMKIKLNEKGEPESVK